MAVNDDYLPCKSYAGQEADPKNEGFTAFQDKKTKKYYFALVDNEGSVLLKSEGYVDLKSRKNGIASVIKNKSIDGRLSVEKDKKKFFVVLKAGNNKEIARSCDYSSELEAKNAIEKIASKESVAEVASAGVSTNMLASLDGFLNVGDYLDKARIWDSYGITGFVKFQGEDDKYYFGVYNPDATLYLRSQGFNTEDERDNAFDLMESTILLEENYKIENLGGKYYAVLFEESEILAISPDFNSFIEAFVTTPGGRPKETIGTMF
ncbi:MAG TPA: YegP family protein [Leadbetterella sp.]|nr:YegP family protein [Leadbetterella sp.]